MDDEKQCSCFALIATGHLSGYDTVEGISDLLVARALPESPSLVHAKRIIHGLTASTTCSHAATARLLHSCKVVAPKHQTSNSELQLENARNAYAISMSLCASRHYLLTIDADCPPSSRHALYWTCTRHWKDHRCRQRSHKYSSKIRRSPQTFLEKKI